MPGDFPPWQTVYTYFRNWRQDGTWVVIHDHLREWTRIEQDRHRQPSEAVIDSQSVKGAASVHEAVGYDAGKKIKGRKRFLTVDTLGLVLRVLVTAASVPERDGGKQVLSRVKAMGPSIARLNLIWADGGFDGPTLMMWVMDTCRLDGGAHLRMADGMPTLSARLRTAAGNLRNSHLPGDDPYYGQAAGMIFDPLDLFKHPLNPLAWGVTIG